MSLATITTRQVEPGQPNFSELDRRFAEFMQRLSKKPSVELALAATLVSQRRREGHICLDLHRVAGTPWPPDLVPAPSGSRAPEFEPWISGLRECSVVGRPGQFTPLVLDAKGRLYLHRYWKYEADLAAAIEERAGIAADSRDDAWLGEALRRYFPPLPAGELDWQKVAAYTALTRRFCVISGGPGTGKTRTVAALLAMLLEQAAGQPLRMALAAPTGKAAARLSESIENARNSLPCSDSVTGQLPASASTLHRLLGPVRDSVFFRHHVANPLPFDLVVIDEASMVDLALMSKLFNALAPPTRVILLGDKDQLASVEAGSVLGDICVGRPANAFSETARSAFRRVTGEELPPAEANALSLGDCIVELQKNRRFGADNGILSFSRSVNDGDVERAVEFQSSGPGSRRRDEAEDAATDGASPPQRVGYEAGFHGARTGVGFIPLPSAAGLKEVLRPRVLAGFAAAIRALNPKAALEALGQFRILCALRQGPFGAGNVNRLAEEILDGAGLIRQQDIWYAGRPVMVLKNDYDLRLFNGDTGIVMRDASGQMRAFFVDADGNLRGVAPARLPEHETAFAITVHKSQGSEFEEVLLLLPQRDNPVLTRELIYTGVTRASRRVELCCSTPIFRQAVQRRLERASGLGDALWHRTIGRERDNAVESP